MSADDDGPVFEDRDHAHAHEFRSPVSPGAFYRALRAKGFTANAAAGLTGNAIHESGGDANTIWLDPPTGPETGDAAHGAMQWEGRRRDGLRPTLDSTINKIYEEVSTGSQGLSFDSLNRAASPESAAQMVNVQYERPQYPAKSAGARQRYARSVADRFAGPGADDPPTTTKRTAPAPSSGNYLADRQKAKDNERIAASHTAEAHRGTPAGQGRHLAHLHEIHDHLSHLHARIADLEARHERQHRKGVVTDVDNKKHLARIEIGRDCDGSNQVKSPWLPWAQISGGKQGLNVHSPVTVGEQVMLVNPDGSPDFTQALVVRHGWYSTNPSPSMDPSADVTVRGTTINVRSMTAIAHSIGGSLSGPLMSIISGGITRLIDKLGHHISAPGATVDSSAQTHTHDSSDTHTDTSMNDMTHMSQNKNIVQKATNGSHQTIAKTVTHSASQSMSFSAQSISFT